MVYKELGKTGLRVSRLGLGTAEIGFQYGIGPRPLPSNARAEYLLQTAVDLGINFFDTASIYGLAEERLGKFGISKMGGVVIATKCASVLDRGFDLPTEDIKIMVTKDVEASLRKLRLDVLPLVLLHGGTSQQIKSGMLSEIMQELRALGKISHFGISVRGEDVALAAIESGVFETISVAYSILDQRMSKKVLPLATAKNIGVINRSVFLKGSLTPLVGKLPATLRPLKEKSDKARILAGYWGMDSPSLAVRFVLSNPHISTSLIGTNNVEHLAGAVRSVEMGVIEEWKVGVLERLAIENPSQVDPAKWLPVA